MDSITCLSGPSDSSSTLRVFGHKLKGRPHLWNRVLERYGHVVQELVYNRPQFESVKTSMISFLRGELGIFRGYKDISDIDDFFGYFKQYLDSNGPLMSAINKKLTDTFWEIKIEDFDLSLDRIESFIYHFEKIKSFRSICDSFQFEDGFTFLGVEGCNPFDKRLKFRQLGGKKILIKSDLLTPILRSGNYSSILELPEADLNDNYNDVHMGHSVNLKETFEIQGFVDKLKLKFSTLEIKKGYTFSSWLINSEDSFDNYRHLLSVLSYVSEMRDKTCIANQANFIGLDKTLVFHSPEVPDLIQGIMSKGDRYVLLEFNENSNDYSYIFGLDLLQLNLGVFNAAKFFYYLDSMNKSDLGVATKVFKLLKRYGFDDENSARLTALCCSKKYLPGKTFSPLKNSASKKLLNDLDYIKKNHNGTSMCCIEKRGLSTFIEEINGDEDLFTWDFKKANNNSLKKKMREFLSMDKKLLDGEDKEVSSDIRKIDDIAKTLEIDPVLDEILSDVPYGNIEEVEDVKTDCSVSITYKEERVIRNVFYPEEKIYSIKDKSCSDSFLRVSRCAFLFMDHFKIGVEHMKKLTSNIDVESIKICGLEDPSFYIEQFRSGNEGKTGKEKGKVCPFKEKLQDPDKGIKYTLDQQTNALDRENENGKRGLTKDEVFSFVDLIKKELIKSQNSRASRKTRSRRDQRGKRKSPGSQKTKELSALYGRSNSIITAIFQIKNKSYWGTSSYAKNSIRKLNIKVVNALINSGATNSNNSQRIKQSDLNRFIGVLKAYDPEGYDKWRNYNLRLVRILYYIKVMEAKNEGAIDDPVWGKLASKFKALNGFKFPTSSVPEARMASSKIDEYLYTKLKNYEGWIAGKTKNP